MKFHFDIIISCSYGRNPWWFVYGWCLFGWSFIRLNNFCDGWRFCHRCITGFVHEERSLHAIWFYGDHLVELVLETVAFFFSIASLLWLVWRYTWSNSSEWNRLAAKASQSSASDYETRDAKQLECNGNQNQLVPITWVIYRVIFHVTKHWTHQYLSIRLALIQLILCASHGFGYCHSGFFLYFLSHCSRFE